MSEEDFFYTGVEDEDYDFLNNNEDIKGFKWKEFFLNMFEDWAGKTKIHTPFAYLQKFLFPIHSYSRRIECSNYLQNVALDVIEDEYQMKEWCEDLDSYIRYNERLRELKERNIRPIPIYFSKVSWLEEVNLLMQHITPRDMIAFIAHIEQIRDLLSIKRDPKHFATFYSTIYRDNSAASIGIMPIMVFCREFSSAEEYRCRLIAQHRQKVPITPVSVNCRTECFNMYIAERAKHMKEEIMEKDKTRPYEPSELECLKMMYENDKNFVEASNIIHNSEEIKPWLDNMLSNSQIVEDSEQKGELKIRQLNEAYGGPFRLLSMEEVNASVKEHLDNMVHLMNCYIRLLEERINTIISETSTLPSSEKPTQDDLNNTFTYKYRQTQAYSNLIDKLLREKQKVGKAADADWRRHALVLFEARKKVLISTCPNQFTDWLNYFCDLFGRERVPYMEPGKIHKAQKKSCIECYMP